MSLSSFLETLGTSPETVSFDDTVSVIEENYSFIETAFTNGDAKNEEGQNNGSCKIFAFAQLNHLNSIQTLNCFGKYYREDVLQHPENNDHGYIRQFMNTGLNAIQFENNPLIEKSKFVKKI